MTDDRQRQRAERIRGLRQAIEFIESRPDLPEFYCSGFTAVVRTVDAFRHAATLMRSGDVSEVAGRDYIEARTSFAGGVQVVVAIRREHAYPQVDVRPLLSKVEAS
jgi:hypothetical protein